MSAIVMSKAARFRLCFYKTACNVYLIFSARSYGVVGTRFDERLASAKGGKGGEVVEC